MENKKQSRFEEPEYEVDALGTLWSNISYIMIISMLFVIVVAYVAVYQQVINRTLDPIINLLLVMGFAFSTIKLVSYCYGPMHEMKIQYRKVKK